MRLPAAPLPGIPLDLGARQDEDCLTLNIWAPTGGAGAKPVMVWLHGGAYVLGSGSQPFYDGNRLADSGDVVIVTVNYRLGAFGFLDLSVFNRPTSTFDSNIGLRDVLAALQWVQDNIAAFGGDPERVTLFGESAGAGLVTTLLAVPAAKGLFSAAIAQSSPATSVYDRGRAEVMANAMLHELGMGTGEVNQLRQVPVPKLIAATKKLFDEVPVRNPGTLAFVPFVDGDVPPDYPVKVAREGGSHPVPLIIGTNKQEAALFADAIAADADHAEGHHVDVRPDRRRATRPATAHRGDRRGLREVAGSARASPSPVTSASGCRRYGWPRGTARWPRPTSTGSTTPPRCSGCS